MRLDLDSTVLLLFLAINLIVGIVYGRGIKNIKEYAVGNKDFSTMTIAATLIATTMSGSGFFSDLSQSYTNGLYYMWPILLGSLTFFIYAFIFAPRLGEFLGKISIAEAMGDLYGKKVRVISAISACIGTCGIMAAQLKVSGLLFEYAFGLSSTYGIILSSIVIAIYSSFGGIKSVTFTDVIQLFTFGTIIPTLAFFVFGSLDNLDTIEQTIRSNETFNYKEVFDFTKSKSLSYLFLFVYMIIPGFEAAIFQRIAMAKNTMQVRNSFTIAGITYFTIVIIVMFIGVLVLTSKPDLKPNEVVKHVIFEYSYTGLKGLTLIGIMAMVMSTVDSFINSTSVLIVHDFCAPLKIKFLKDELTASRFTSFIITFLAAKLAMSGDSILELIILAASFYMPVVTIPFIMAILGFRTSTKAVLIAMSAGFLTTVSWMIFLPAMASDALIPALLMNLLFLFGSHYLLKQPGGWVGIKDEAPLRELKQKRKAKCVEFLNNVKNFSLLKFLQQYTPIQEKTYVSVSIFSMISLFATMYALPKDIQQQYKELIDFIFPSSLILTTSLLSFPLWPNFLRERHLIVIMWNLVLFYVLICTGFLFVILNNFSQTQMMIFMINLIIIAFVIRWKLALLMMIVGITLTMKAYEIYAQINTLPNIELSLKFEVSYALLLMSAILVAFIKPQQERQALVEAKINLLGEQIDDRDDELRRLLKLKSEFLNNISHEVRTPITGIAGLSQSLYESYNNLDEHQRYDAVKKIAKNSQRLYSFVSNILDLSKLSSLTYKLHKEKINLSDLVRERIGICIKIYLESKELEFINDIEDDIVVYCDKHYIQSTIDNLIVNAIKYSQGGRITITLNKDDKTAHFSIKDEGIGIPKSELLNIFDVFVVGSKTYTPAGGRGVGLALCKKAIELHNQKIWAESNGKKGSIFFFDLSLS